MTSIYKITYYLFEFFFHFAGILLSVLTSMSSPAVWSICQGRLMVSGMSIT